VTKKIKGPIEGKNILPIFGSSDLPIYYTGIFVDGVNIQSMHIEAGYNLQESILPVGQGFSLIYWYLKTVSCSGILSI